MFRFCLIPINCLALLALPSLLPAGRLLLRRNITHLPGDECDGDGSRRGSSNGGCGKIEVNLMSPSGNENSSVQVMVQMYCYDNEMRNGKKAKTGSVGRCFIPRTDECNSDHQCRWGTSCKISNKHGRRTCEMGVDAGDICEGDGNKPGDCARYSWVRTSEKWTHASLYCVDPSSQSIESFRYASRGMTGICKVWNGEVCSKHEDCWFGLFCEEGICKAGDAKAYASAYANLVMEAARVAHHSYDERFQITDGYGNTHDVISPIAFALKHEANESQARVKYKQMFESMRTSFVTAIPMSLGHSSKSGSSFYWSGDRRWILKQIRANEFKALTSTVLAQLSEDFGNTRIWLDSDSGAVMGTLLNVPVLAIAPGHWIVIPNAIDGHRRVLSESVGYQVSLPRHFDVKPMPARSYERQQLLAFLLTANDGHGIEIEKMKNFRTSVENMSMFSKAESFAVERMLHDDVRTLDHLHLVDYSILVELYELGKVPDGIDLRHGCAAEQRCSSLSQRCLVLCMTIIDWLRPYEPGNSFGVDMESKMKGDKFLEYGKKTQLTWECIADFGNGYSSLKVLNIDSWIALEGQLNGPRSLYLTTAQEAAGLPDDPCTRRWEAEHSLTHVDFIEDACKPFVQYTDFDIIDGIVDTTCRIRFRPFAKNTGVCQGLDNCRISQSCTYALGQEVGCEDVAIVGNPQVDTLLKQCSHYIGATCRDNYLTDYLSEMEGKWLLRQA